MKKLISTLLIFAMLISMISISVNASFDGEEVLVFTDFEDESKSYADLGFESSGSKAYIGGKSGNGITPALVSGNFTYLERHLGYDLKKANNGEHLDAGTYHVRFSYNSFENASRNDFYIANGTVNNAYKEIVLSTETLNSFGNQWVDVDLEFTVPTLKWNVTVTPETGEVYTGSGTYHHDDNVIPALNWWIKPKSNFLSYTPPTIDDFYVTKELKNTELADSALKVNDSNGEALDINKVPVSGVLFKIDFGSEDVALSVSNENVEIKNGSDIIDYLGYVDGTFWVMEPHSVLNFNTTYEVLVKAGIPDGFGMEIEPKIFEFSTVANTVSGLFFDFEDETKTYEDLGFEATGSRIYVKGKEGNGITAALVSGNFTYLQRHMGFPIKAEADGNYKIKYDFNAGVSAKENTMYFARGTGSSAPRSVIFETTDLNTFGDSWVTVEVEFNVPSLEWKATITPENGEKIEKSGEYTGSATNGVAAVQWWITPNSNFGSTTPPVIDNLEVTAEYENAPMLLTDNIAFYAGETEYLKNAVGVDTDRIVLNFGQMMNTEDLTEDNFIIRNKEDGTIVPVGISYKGLNEVILNIIPKTLEKNTDYELEIGNIRNVSGIDIGGTSSFDFTVAGSNAKSAVVKKIIKNSKAVSKVSDLTAGKATLYVECEGLEKLGLIALYYNKDEFVIADFSETEVFEDGILNIDFNVTDKEFDRVEFILIDSFGNLTVLSDKTILGEELTIGEVLAPTENKKETSFEIKRNPGEDIITVLGETDANEYVLIFVEDENALLLKSNENGAFEAELSFTKTGNYEIFVKGANDDAPKSVTFDFSVFSEYKKAIDALVLAENEVDFINLVKENKEVLGVDRIYSEDATKLYYEEFKNVIDNENYDYEKNQNEYLRSYVIAGLNDKADIEVSADIKKLYSDDELIVSYMDKYVNDDKAKEYFSDKLKGKNIKVYEREKGESFEDELKDAVNEAIILTSIKYADGPDEAKDILKAFDDVLDLGSLTSKKTVYNVIRGENYTSINDLKDAYKDAVAESEKTSGGGGGGSSSGSSSGKYTGSSPVTSFPVSSQVKEQAETINIKFEDLDSVDWAYSDISELYEKGIIAGVSEARFNPLGEVKREQFIKMIVCAMGLENTSAEYAGFSDVSYGAWFEKYISIAKANGLVSGIGDNLFGTDMNITRQDMAVMLYNAMCKKGYVKTEAENNFADAEKCADYAGEAVAELSALGIINGVGDNLYEPAQTATRAQAAVIINRALDYLD